jgi:GT2 family glycosyltransferase
MEAKIAVVTGYSKDPEFLKALLKALDRQTVKNFDCYIYASPNSFYFLDESFFDTLSFKCYQLKLKENRGFAGNNNDTINFAFKNKDYDYFILANDDTIPYENWLQEMVKTAASATNIGAVAAKMVFYEKFATITGVVTTDAPTTTVALHQSQKHTGIRLYTNTKFTTSYYPKRFYLEGFFGEEEDEINKFRYVDTKFSLELPLNETTADNYHLHLFARKNSGIKNQSIILKLGDTVIGDLVLDDDKVCYEIAVPKSLVEKHTHFIIQNTGSELTPKRSYEIGFGEIDKGQYEEEREVTLFCGGACLITRQALLKTGIFMDGYFSYYEDSDLSVRLRKNGFRIIYSPKSVIKHFHTGTSKEWSPLFTYYAFRNKIIFSAKIFGLKAFIEAFYERAHETYVYFKLYVRSRFKNHDYRYRLKLNLVILKDSLMGILKFKPKFLSK